MWNTSQDFKIKSDVSFVTKVQYIHVAANKCDVNVFSTNTGQREAGVGLYRLGNQVIINPSLLTLPHVQLSTGMSCTLSHQDLHVITFKILTGEKL